MAMTDYQILQIIFAGQVINTKVFSFTCKLNLHFPVSVIRNLNNYVLEEFCTLNVYTYLINI